MGLRDLVVEIRAIVVEASKMALKLAAAGFEVQQKGRGQGPVTSVDREVNDWLVGRISSLFPSDTIISEESPPIQPEGSLNSWYIDPIDGTKSLIDGTGEWSVMVGLARGSEAALGVIVEPVNSRVYWAYKNGGAFAGDFSPSKGVRLNTRRVSSLNDAVAALSRHHPSQKTQQLLNYLGVQKTYKQGSVGLKIAHIAEGRADLYVNFSGKCSLWDLCSADAILYESGGTVCTLDGARISYAGPDARVDFPYLAVSNSIAPLMMNRIEGFRPKGISKGI